MEVGMVPLEVGEEPAGGEECSWGGGGDGATGGG